VTNAPGFADSRLQRRGSGAGSDGQTARAAQCDLAVPLSTKTYMHARTRVRQECSAVGPGECQGKARQGH
jgi:hypothetical protein